MNPDRHRLHDEFDDLLDQIDKWREHQGTAGTYEQAGHLIAAMREVLFAAGFLEIVRHRIYAEARDRDEDAPPQPSDMRGGKSMLRAQRRLLIDGMTDIAGPSRVGILVSDTEERIAGREPLIGGDSEVRPKFLLKALKRQSILTAHYLAARDNRGWLDVHTEITPLYSPGGRKEWNMNVLLADRELARSAGLHRGRQQPLSHTELAMEEQVLRFSIAEQRRLLEILLAGGKID